VLVKPFPAHQGGDVPLDGKPPPPTRKPLPGIDDRRGLNPLKLLPKRKNDERVIARMDFPHVKARVILTADHLRNLDWKISHFGQAPLDLEMDHFVIDLTERTLDDLDTALRTVGRTIVPLAETS